MKGFLQVIADMRKSLDELEALVSRMFDKPYTNQGGPGVDPSQPAPKEHE